MIVKIDWKEVADTLDIGIEEFPKYVSPLLNLANQYAQGTRPAVVGQMSELMEEFPGECVAEWEQWYGQRMPEAMDEAVDRIQEKVAALKLALDRIDRAMISRWVRDLVICKTYQGMRFQVAVLVAVADRMGRPWRRANPKEEAVGIDGYIGDTPVSVKPETYEDMRRLPEEIEAVIVIYRKTRSGIEAEYDPAAFR